ALEAAQSYSSHTELEKVYLFIAKNFADLGQYREGLTYLNQAMETLTLKSQTELSRLSNERNLTLEVIYEEQKRKEAENRAHNIQIIVLTLFVLLIIAVSIIWWITILMKRRQKLYQQIVKQNLELIEAKKEVEKSQSHNTDDKDLTNVLNDNRDFLAGETNRSKILFNTLIKLMEKDKIYRDPLLTREEIISRLNTNPTYLTQAIKQFSGKNYSQFINSYRIKEAVEILSDKDKIEIPIKTICTEVGFNSMATFYKIFQSTVGLSPAAYRKSLLHISALKENEPEE
ncbi:MAG: helix-turn-helix domain-containing protein, partial [Muribaculaceae bacterium]|nr:helix-turn-helix domain-containing protein [Muribaculaceae bacterium]